MHPYAGKAHQIYQNIVGDNRVLSINRMYRRKNTIFYINKSGYLHCYTIGKVKLNNENIGYCVTDYYLNKKGVFKESGTHMFTAIESFVNFFDNVADIN